VSRHRGIFLPACACGALLLAAYGARAAEQDFDPRVELGGLYNSNLRLVSAQFDDKVTGGYVDALAKWSVLTPRTDFVLIPRVHATAYSGSGESNTTDAYLNGDLAHRLTSGRLDLAVDLSRQEVLTNQLLYANGGGGLGTPSTGAVGLAFNNNRAFFVTVRPTGQFTLGPRTQLLVDTKFVRVNYDQTNTSSQNDYTDVSGSVGLSFQATPRVRWVTNVTGNRFTPQAGNQDTDNIGANVELWREQSQSVRGYIRLGAVRSEFTGSSLPSTTNFVGGLGVQRDFASGQLFLQANRRVDGSGYGQMVLRDELNLQMSRKLTERVLLLASAVGVWIQPAEASSTLARRRYYAASLGGEWRVRRTISILARYQYSSNHYDNVAGTPDSNAVYAGVAFEPHRRD
jgi:hypothetical protein